MDDYISKQDAIDAIMEQLKDRSVTGEYSDGYDDGTRTSAVIVSQLPSADVQPVTPMHWTPISPFNGEWSDVWRCSACGSQVSLGYCTDMMEYDFCPYCGARDGDKNDKRES